MTGRRGFMGRPTSTTEMNEEANVQLKSDATEPAPTRPALLQAVPNLLTLSRLALGIAFPLIPAAWQSAALLAAAATEFLDGWIARRLCASGTTGRLLDPVADKVVVASVLATLVSEGTVKPWQLLLVMSRDLVVAVGAMWVAARRGISALREMFPSRLGKVATAAQFLFLLAVVSTRNVNAGLLIVTSVICAGAAIEYAWRSP